jgi:hypothetical protein
VSVALSWIVTLRQEPTCQKVGESLSHLEMTVLLYCLCRVGCVCRCLTCGAHGAARGGPRGCDCFLKLKSGTGQPLNRLYAWNIKQVLANIKGQKPY